MRTYNLLVTVFDLTEEELFDAYPGLSFPKTLETIMYERNFPCEIVTNPKKDEPSSGDNQKN